MIDINPARSEEIDSTLIGSSRIWESATPYQPTHYAKRSKDKAEAVARDVIAECLRRGLPRPEVEVLEFAVDPDEGNCAIRLRLRFAVEGPRRGRL